MIGYLKGKVADTWNQGLLLITPGGVGYRVNLPAHTFADLPPAGEDVELYASLVVREDAMELYGFATLAEQQTFDILRSISRIGSRTALAILSAYRPDELHDLVAEKNQAAFAKIPGIGGKTAQHLLLELGYRLSSMRKPYTMQPQALPTAQKDALEALLNLGYSEDECSAIVKRVFQKEPDLDPASAIRMALKQLAKGKS